MTWSCLDGLVYELGQLGHAWFSPDMAHRYLLLRTERRDVAAALGDPITAFVMLNPSTATADVDDRTIAKCRKYALREAYRVGGRDRTPLHHTVAIVNLYAIRATDPDVAFAHPRPIGGIVNDDVILAVARAAAVTIAAWGADKRSRGRAAEVKRLIVGAGVALHRLGDPSKDGSPKHPLYLKDSTELQVWR